MDLQQPFSSRLLEDAVGALSRLPGVGRKTAVRLALHLLRRDEQESLELGRAIIDMRQGIRYCRVCHNISETEVCPLCASPGRDRSTVCVVESVKDVMAIENTGQYRGLYHVLGGVISPMDGIGPDSLEIASLTARVTADTGIAEVILALGATMEGDTTCYYINKLLRRALADSGRSLRVSQPARGMSVGNEIEYTDEVTLGRSIISRIDFDSPA